MNVRRVTKIPVRGRRVSPTAIRDWDGRPSSRPAIDEWIACRLLAGMSPKAVVVASDNAMTVRTAYRWRRELVGLAEVEVGGFRATFAIRRTSPPARVSSWTKVVDKRVDRPA